MCACWLATPVAASLPEFTKPSAPTSPATHTLHEQSIEHKFRTMAVAGKPNDVHINIYIYKTAVSVWLNVLGFVDVRRHA